MFVLVATAMSVVVGSRKLCPGFCTGAKGLVMRSMSEGEQGWALPPAYLMVCVRMPHGMWQISNFLSPGTWDIRSRITWGEITFEGREKLS